MSSNTHTCYKCGAAIPPGAEYCPDCGAPAPLSDDEIAGTSSRVFRNSVSAPIPPQHPVMPDRSAPAYTFETPAPAASTTTPIPHSGLAAASQRPERPSEMANARPARAVASTGTGTSSRTVLIVALVILAVIGAGTALALILGGADDTATHGSYYPLEDISLSANADGSGGTVASVTFGEKVDMIAMGPDRSMVRYTHNGAATTGYAATDMLMDSTTRATLVSIVRGHALRAVPHAYQRRALIDYFRILEADDTGRWRLEVPTMDVYREVYTDRIVNPDSRYEDLAVVITNGIDRRLVLFTFDAAGTARVFGSRSVNGTKIHHVAIDPSEPGGIAADVRND